MVTISIVIPAKNEAGNLPVLLDGIDAALAAHGDYEVLVVDDGSTDATAEVIRARMQGRPGLRLIRHDVSGGQSAAVHSGVRAARGEIVCTLDADGQNPPSELPRLFAPLIVPGSGRIGLVAGQRVGRQDTLSKRLASRAANWIRAKALKDGTRDTGCGLKAFRREGFLDLPFFNHMHRYLPALFVRDGWEIAHVDVGHAARHAGRSHYSNLQRGLVGVVDILGVMWLIRRRKRSRPAEAPRG